MLESRVECQSSRHQVYYSLLEKYMFIISTGKIAIVQLEAMKRIDLQLIIIRLPAPKRYKFIVLTIIKIFCCSFSVFPHQGFRVNVARVAWVLNKCKVRSTLVPGLAYSYTSCSQSVPAYSWPR